MGCDIHLRVEVRNGKGWVPAETLPEYASFQRGRLYDKWEEERRARGDEEYEEERFFHDRNYILFAALAGVRNAWNLHPVAEPRNLPADLSAEAQRGNEAEYEESGHFWLGDHSHTWLTLGELDGYDWNQPLTNEGVMTYQEWKAWKDSGASAPENYCKGRSEPHLSVSIEHTFTLYREWGWDRAEREVTVARWTTPLREAIGPRWFNFVERLHRLGKPEDVRLVFGFDS